MELQKNNCTLCETHLHTADVSICGGILAKEIPQLYKNKGFKNIIVTDHWNEHTLSQFSGNNHEKNEKWQRGYKIIREECEKLNMTAFLGMELSITGCVEDYLIYGVTDEFLKDYPALYNCTIDEVFKAVEESGLLIYQAHPFRPYIEVRPFEFLHGVEVFNMNPRHDGNNNSALTFAKKHNLLQLAGSDFHQYEDVARGGIYLPSDIKTNSELVNFLRLGKYKLYNK